MKLFIPAFLLVSLVAGAQSKSSDGIFKLDQDYKMSSTGTLRLHVSDAKVVIKGSTRTSAHVRVDRVVNIKGLSFGHQEFSMDINENNGDLDIRERSNSTNVGIVGYYYEKYEIEIELPAGVNLIVRGDDGGYRINNINGSISLDLDDANAELLSCGGSDFEFRVDDGDVNMDGGRGKLHVNGDDADVRIRNAAFTAIDADIDDGDFIVESSLADTGDYRIRTQDGMVAFTVTGGGGQFDIRHDDGSVTTDPSFSRIEDSENRTVVKVGNGRSRVDIHGDDARIKLFSK